MSIDDKYKDIISKLKTCIDLLARYMQDLSIMTAAKSRSIGKKMDGYIQKLVKNVAGIKQYKSLLVLENDYYQWNAVMNLFPLFPKICLETMKKSTC